MEVEEQVSQGSQVASWVPRIEIGSLGFMENTLPVKLALQLTYRYFPILESRWVDEWIDGSLVG